MNRMVAYNGQVMNDTGIIWCMVEEDKPGYLQMIGRDELAAPWYLATFNNFTDEEGNIDYVAAGESADRVAQKWNEEQGFTPEQVRDIVASSMRVSF